MSYIRYANQRVYPICQKVYSSPVGLCFQGGHGKTQNQKNFHDLHKQGIATVAGNAVEAQLLTKEGIGKVFFK
jgi:hypothetical protein